MTRRQSYLGATFDRCEACSDVALDAILQSALYLLARAVPEAVGRPTGQGTFAYRLRMRLEDEDGNEIAADEVEADQQIDFEMDAADGTSADGATPAGEPDPDDLDPGEAETSGRAAHASLEDFQAMVDRLVLEPAGPNTVSGLISGRLFGFERLIGRFEVLVAPC